MMWEKFLKKWIQQIILFQLYQSCIILKWLKFYFAYYFDKSVFHSLWIM